jgi:capsular exopolysaccharide synthesis family protein
LDLVYENIQLLNSGLALNSIAVTSAIAGEGKTTVVLGLALSAARRHKTVLVIDANLRRPSLHLHLDLANEKGLSSLLTGETNKPLLKRVSLLNTSIDVLTAGTVPTDPIRLLSSPQLEKLIAKFEEIYDLVIIDAPSTLGMVDAIQTASYCSGTVMVVRLDRVTSSELTEATALLSKLNVLGVVANGSKETRYGGQNPYLLTGTTS